MSALGDISAIRRYPVKSMLGEDLDTAALTSSGVDGDRELALIDLETGRIATAKHPRLWRKLLQFSAARDGDAVRITLPNGTTVVADDTGVDRELSDLLDRRVHLTGVRPSGASVERPTPEDVLEHGEDADVPYEMLEIAMGTSGSTFVDYAPVHLITTATLEHIQVESVRYRPNIVIATTSVPPFAENDWVGREFTIGRVRLRGILPTPRCSVPTLEHGTLPRSPQAVRTVLAGNRIDVPGFGVLPCAGLYAEVLQSGTVQTGDSVSLN